MILTRPGSAPADGKDELARRTPVSLTESQQRSLSLPKSFMSNNQSKQSDEQFSSWKHQQATEESPWSSPTSRIPTPDTAHTAPVTPSHDLNRIERHKSPGRNNHRSSRRSSTNNNKASSTPHLINSEDSPEWEVHRNWSDERMEGSEDDKGLTEASSASPIHNPHSQSTDSSKEHVYPRQSSLPQKTGTTGSVLQKFRKTFSLRFQRSKLSKESSSTDYGGLSQGCSLDEGPGEIYNENYDCDPSTQNIHGDSHHKEESEQKYRFGPLVWRSSKERKKGNKAARNAKCNSGDSGIQLEMASGCTSGAGSAGTGGGGDSSESHDTDQQGEDTDSPPAVRRRVGTGGRSSRPHSDLINQILIDKFKADLQSRTQRHSHVRRTNSDLGGQRLLQWDTRGSYRRMFSSPSPIKMRPQRLSPRHAPSSNNSPANSVLMRHNRRTPGRPQLRRSLSQPLDIDKLSPLMRTKTMGSRPHGAHVFSEDEHDCHGGTSDDEEMLSDSESSLTSLSERKRSSLETGMADDIVILAEAVWDHIAMESEELAFRAGDVIEVLETVDKDWWWGATNGSVGWFPAAFVRLRVNQEDTVEDCLAAMASGQSSTTSIRRRTSISLLSNEQVRTSVVRELVHTERDFVKVLRDVSEGYISECRKRCEMFSEEQIQTIFINLEELLEFQTEFLNDLESCIDWDAPHRSCIGDCFLKHKSGFRKYSDYCNSHPMAIATLQELYQINSYNKFFEACRLMRGLIEIPLDGYLLTPVQRICKYPLQLAELLKYTKSDHPDYSKIQEALETMRGVAVLINERKRRMESLEKLAAWQQRVEGWEGEDLIEVSTQLIHQGDVIRVTTGMWTNNITLFLFDHQIVYCKKDLLKRNTYVYKGRICLDTSEIIDVPDGKEPQVGVTVKHGLKIYSCVRDKWLLFCCRSAAEKECWLSALAEERRLVARDRLEGLDFPPAARQLARMAARSHRQPPHKPRNDKSYKRDSAYMGSSLQLNTTSHNSLGRKVGTWFTFGGSKKGRHHHHAPS
ncbi:uncharacterized protein LOC123293913 [Chrysoperla carnea]|uniref:uncharacterized protein LOC123293913 n=1 Tax=Chrysoperla carnea TaxID=189513 RepID=UPI001D05F9C0|nr:uncharacterized protein LOC123293913 [Chrysoperla carnea]